MTGQQWDRVRTVLDDPAVPEVTKRELLGSWVAAQDRLGPDADEVNDRVRDLDARDEVSDARERADRDGPADSHAPTELEQRWRDAAAHREHAADDRRREELTRRSVEAGGTGIASSDEILGTGDTGLRYFQLFLPRFTELTGLDFPPSRLRQRYDELCGIDLAALRADAETLTGPSGVSEALRDCRAEVRGGVATAQAVWRGDAADAAEDHHRRFQQVAERVDTAVGGLGGVLEETAACIETECLARADGVAELFADRIDGRSATDVDLLIRAGRMDDTLRPDDWERIAGWLGGGREGAIVASPGAWDGSGWVPGPEQGGLRDRAGELDPAARDEVVLAARDWLTTTFRADVEAALEAFDTVCTSTHDNVELAYEVLLNGADGDGGLAGLDPDPFAELGIGLAATGAQGASGGGSGAQVGLPSEPPASAGAAASPGSGAVPAPRFASGGASGGASSGISLPGGSAAGSGTALAPGGATAAVDPGAAGGGRGGPPSPSAGGGGGGTGGMMGGGMMPPMGGMAGGQGGGDNERKRANQLVADPEELFGQPVKAAPAVIGATPPAAKRAESGS